MLTFAAAPRLSFTLGSTVFVSLVCASLGHAQGLITSTQATRTAYAQAFGFDYEFNDGIATNAENLAPTGDWDTADSAHLFDYYGIEVGEGAFSQSSVIAGDELSFDLTSSAATTGNLFSSDALARTEFEVAFTLGSTTRVFWQGAARTDLGYNLASVRLESADGSLVVVDLAADYGAQEYRKGQVEWLPAGDYVLSGNVEAQTFGAPGQESLQKAEAEFLLTTHHRADFNCDNFLDERDLIAFRSAWAGGSLSADFDRSGGINAADLEGFERTWKAGW